MVVVTTSAYGTGEGCTPAATSPAAVRDLTESLEVDEARIGARSGKDEARLVLLSKLGDLVVVDEAGVLVHGVRHDVEVLARNVDRAAVREVPAVRKAHAEHGVARLKQREESRKIGVRAAVSLHVGVLGAEQLFGAVDRECLDDVDVFAAAVISFAGIALGILVGEMGAHCRHDSRRDDVLAGDELNVVLLSPELVFHCGAELGRVGGIDLAVIGHDGVNHAQRLGIHGVQIADAVDLLGRA